MITTDIELKRINAERRKEAAEMRKQVVEAKRKMTLALKRVGPIITPCLWEAPPAVKEWVSSIITKAFVPKPGANEKQIKAQKKQAQDLIDGLAIHGQHMELDKKRKADLESRRKELAAKKKTAGEKVEGAGELGDEAALAAAAQAKAKANHPHG